MGKGFTVWFTGLTAAGKTTVSRLVARKLEERGCQVEWLDAEEVRRHIGDGLGFTKEDRDRNVRRIGYICQLLSRHGVVAVAAAISPYRSTREALRAQSGDFVEVYVKCPLDVCEARDWKGIYRKARAGEIEHVAGLSDPYEEPLEPDVLLETDRQTPEECAVEVMRALEEMGYVPPHEGETSTYSHEERAEVEKRLRDLGYI